MDTDTLKRELQDHFSDALVTIIGSGLSAAEGIPGMVELRDHLSQEIPRRVTGGLSDEWERIAGLLDAGMGLETALHEVAPSAELETLIAEVTGQVMLDAEASVMAAVIGGGRSLKLTHLLEYMLKPNRGLPIITTNYDRLIEVAGECAGLGVDTLFVGHHIGVLDEKESRLSFCRDYRTLRRNALQLIFKDRLTVLKPHGSLDWFLLDGEPIRCPCSLNLPRLIITPGLNKYRSGYDRPFDAHRERANREIDEAARYLLIGYGFQDEHLETHLHPQIRSGKPALVLTRTLSSAGEDLLAHAPKMMAISADPNPGTSGAWLTTNKTKEFVSGPNLWDVEVFTKEVFEP